MISRILEINLSAQTISQLTIIQYLQQDIINIRVCFFNFIQQNTLNKVCGELFQ